MAETFKCPSCSAPLDFEGTTFQKCKFCGSSVIVPAEVFHRPQTKDPLSFDLSSLTGKALKIAEIQREISSGNKINAIKIFHETFGTSLKEAKDAVDAMERGEGVDISGMRVASGKRALTPKEFETAKQVGVVAGSSIVFTFILASFIIFVIGAGISLVVYFAVRSTPNSPISTQITEYSIAGEIAKFGGEGTGAGKFKDNRRVAVDGKGRVYSGNYEGGKIQVFDSNGTFLDQFLTPGISNLKDLIADRHGKIYLVHQNGVSAYKGETGEAAGSIKVNRIEGIALTVDQKIVLAGNKGFKFYGSDLKLEREINDAAEQANAVGGFEKIAIDGNGIIYAIDDRNGEICKFSPEGKFLNRISSGLRSPDDIAISNAGKIFLSNVSKIHIFDENGMEIDSFAATQAFGMDFNEADELFVASRPFVVKFRIDFQRFTK